MVAVGGPRKGTELAGTVDRRREAALLREGAREALDGGSEPGSRHRCFRALGADMVLRRYPINIDE